MTAIPDAANYIQQEEVAAYAPDSESTLYKVGGSMNYLLNHYPIPPGATVEFNGPESNVNLLFMIPQDGRAISRTTYANLFAAIGTYWGAGDGISTFNVPDKRGLFCRMVDTTSAGTAGRDPDASSRTPTGTGTATNVGSYEADIVGPHDHYTRRTTGTGSGQSLEAAGGTPDPTGVVTWTTGDTGIGSETRPKNVYVLLCIKT